MTVAEVTAEFRDGSLSARYALAVANALMAAVVGTLTLGIGVGIIGALVMAALPFMPVLRRGIGRWAAENPFGALLGVFLLFWIVGSIVWGLKFAFGVALVLAPTMLAIVVYLTLGRPVPAGDH